MGSFVTLEAANHTEVGEKQADGETVGVRTSLDVLNTRRVNSLTNMKECKKKVHFLKLT